MVGPFKSRGHQILDGLVEKCGTLRAVARMVPQIHENQLGNYHREKHDPLIQARRDMETGLGIPFFSWDEPPLEEEVDGAA